MDEFVKTLLIIGLIIFALFLLQPGSHFSPGLANFFAKPTSTSGGAVATTTPTLSATGNHVSYSNLVAIDGVSLSYSSAFEEVRIKVKTSSPRAVNFRNWTLKSSKGTFALPAITLTPGQILRLFSSDSSLSYPGSLGEVRFYYGRDIISAQDTLSLYDPSGRLIEKYGY